MFNEGGLNLARKAGGDQGLAEGLGLAEQDGAADLGDAVSAVVFDDLGVEQAGVDAPGAAAFIDSLHPPLVLVTILARKQAVSVLTRYVVVMTRGLSCGNRLPDFLIHLQ